MTLQEAIRSGKPFRREAWTYNDLWICLNEDGMLVIKGNGRYFAMLAESFLADDWVIDESEGE